MPDTSGVGWLRCAGVVEAQAQTRRPEKIASNAKERDGYEKHDGQQMRAGHAGVRVYTCQPFHDAKAGQLVANSWVWHTVQGKGTADYEANVKFALDGTNPEVSVTQLYSNPR